VGDAALGAYSLALAWNLTLAQFADLGMNTLLTRDLARQPADTPAYVSASLIAKTVLAILLALALVIAAPALAQGDAAVRALQLGAALILLNAWYGTFTAVFRAFGRMMPILILNAGGLAVQALVTALLVMRGAGVESLIVLAVLIQLAQLLGAGLLYTRDFVSGRAYAKVNRAYILQLVRAGIPFAIAGILTSVELRANIFLLGALAGERAVGWYSAASRLNEGLRLAPNAFFGAMLPALAALNSPASKMQLVAFFRRGEWALLAFGCAAAVILTVTAPWLIPFLYGDAFAPAIPVLIVLGWGLIPGLLAGLLVLYLYALGDEHFVNWLIGIGLGIQIGVALILIRSYGAVGTAIAAMASDIALWLLLRQRIAERQGNITNHWRAFVKQWLPPVALFGAALLFRIIPIIQNSFDGLYGQDAYAYYSYAQQLFDALQQFHGPPPFWWPLGYPILLDAGFLVGGVSVASAQAITVLCGALVAPFGYGLAREAAPKEFQEFAGWVAGLLCAIVGQLVQSSVVIMADAPALMWATLGAWLLLRFRRTSETWSLFIGAIAVGLAVWTRWQNLLFAGVWFFALIVIVVSARKRSAWRAGGLVLLAVALIALVLLPQMIIRWTTGAQLAGQSWLEGWSPADFLARSFDTVDGHFDYAFPVSIFYAQVFVHPAYLVALMTPFMLLGAWVLLKNFRGDPAPAILLLGWCGLMFLFLAGIPYENFRFPLGLFVPIAVVTGIGAGWLWDAWRIRWTRAALLAWIAVALAIMIFWQPRVLAPVLQLKTRELSDARWLEQQLPRNALLYTMEIDGAVEQYTPLHVVNLLQMDPSTLNDNVPTFLYINLNEIQTQWRGRLPEQLYNALQEGDLLHPLGTRGDWTLFRIHECQYRILDCD